MRLFSQHAVCLCAAAAAAVRCTDALRQASHQGGGGNATVASPGRKGTKAALRQQREMELQEMRAVMRSYETLQSLPADFSDDEESSVQFAMLGLQAKELAARNPEFKRQWADLWRQQPQQDTVERLECGDIHMRYSMKRLNRLYDFGHGSKAAKQLEQKARSLCRFGKSATVFIWHMHDGNVGHVGMLLGPPTANFENYRLTRYDAADVGMHNEYTPGIGPHKAFSGCRNHPSSWRSGNCFTYVSWWPAAPGVRQNPLTPVEASMHDFDSDQASEDPMEPEVIPIDDLTGAEVQSAFEYFQRLRGKSDKTYNLVTENCAIGVARVLAFGACSADPCMHDATKITKDATGDLALRLYEESGCEGAYCKICFDGDPTCGMTTMFDPNF